MHIVMVEIAMMITSLALSMAMEEVQSIDFPILALLALPAIIEVVDKGLT